jgi:hypothetical protein
MQLRIVASEERGTATLSDASQPLLQKICIK